MDAVCPPALTANVLINTGRMGSVDPAAIAGCSAGLRAGAATDVFCAGALTRCAGVLDMLATANLGSSLESVPSSSASAAGSGLGSGLALALALGFVDFFGSGLISVCAILASADRSAASLASSITGAVLLVD